MAKQSTTSSTSKFKLALLAFLVLTIAAPTLCRMQPTTETNPEVMKAIIQELGKEQLAAYYMQKIMAENQQLGLEDPKLAMVIEQNQLKCTRSRGYCDINNPNCCEGLTCQRIRYPDSACL